MVDFRKGLSVHGGGEEGDIVTLDANKEIKASGIKISEIADKAKVEDHDSRIDALEESMGNVLDRLIEINGEN